MERLTTKMWDEITFAGNGCTVEQLKLKLFDYEEAEEQGLLLRLPCKVGDIVYQTMFIPKEGKCGIVEGVIECIAYKHVIGFQATKIKVRNIDNTLSVWDDYDFEKYVFLTKAEAEKALAEMG